MKRVPRTYSRYPLRGRGGHGEDMEHSAPATASSPTSKVRHASQLLPEQRHVHLVEVKYCEDTQPNNQLKASKQQHHKLSPSFKGLSSSHPPYYYVRCGRELGLDTHAATKLALKLHAHPVQHAYKLASTRRALEKTSFTSHHQDQAWATASNPPDPH
eukprot:1156979-Pelagomonas_calceolata.AAC.1